MKTISEGKSSTVLSLTVQMVVKCSDMKKSVRVGWRISSIDYGADDGDLVNYNKLLVCQFLCSLAPAGIYRNWKIVILHLRERRGRGEYAIDKVASTLI